MKILFTILLLVFSVLVTTCSKSDALVNTFKQTSPQQILEITSDFSGLYWMNGEVLVFRLYDDKRVEYDEYPLNKTQYKAVRAEKVKNTKQVKINDVEFQEIIDILANGEFLKIQEVITPQKSCIDAFIDTEIKFNLNNLKKQIVIKDHCSTLADPKSTASLFNNFPSKMNAFFEILTKIKNKESAGMFYN